MDRMKQLKVFYHERKVSTLALYNKVFLPKTDPFGALFGVFADSLPDGWGRTFLQAGNAVICGIIDAGTGSDR